MFGLNDSNSQSNSKQPGGLPPGPFADDTHAGGPNSMGASDSSSAPALPPLPPDPMETNPPSIIRERSASSSPGSDSADSASPPADSSAAPAPADDELLDLKEQALNNLAPL